MTWQLGIAVIVLSPLVIVFSAAASWVLMRFVFGGRVGRRQVWRGLMPREESP